MQRIFRGDVAEVAERQAGAPLLIGSGTTLRLALEGAEEHYVEFTCTTDSVADCVAGLVAAWNLSTDRLIREATAEAAEDGLTMLLTAVVPGRPLLRIVVSATGNVDLSTARSAQQQVAEPSTATTGTFTLTFRGKTTPGINHNANAAEVQAALENLTTISAGNVSVSASTDGIWIVAFTGSLAVKDLPELAPRSYLYGPGDVIVEELVAGSPPLNFSQAISCTGSVPAESGTWTMTWNGLTTEGIPATASVEVIQQALTNAFGVELYPSILAWNAWDGQPTVVHDFTVRFLGDPGTLLNGPAFTVASHLRIYAEVVSSVFQEGISSEYSEVKSFAIPATVGAGTYQLVLNGEATAELAYNANAATIQSALEALSTIGTGNIVVTTAGTSFLLAWQGAHALENIGEMTAVSTLTSPVSITPATTRDGVAGNNEQQTLYQTWTTGGTYTLTFAGYTTTALSANSSAAQVKNALEALAVIGTGNLVVSGPTPGTYTLIYQGARKAADQPALTSTCWWTGNPDVLGAIHLTNGEEPIDEQQRLVFTGAGYGTYSITFNNATTSALAWNSTVEDVEAALEAHPSILDVSVTGTAASYLVTFLTTYLGPGDKPAMAINSALYSNQGLMGVSTTTPGSPVAGREEITITVTGASSGDYFTIRHAGYVQGSYIECTYNNTAAIVAERVNAAYFGEAYWTATGGPLGTAPVVLTATTAGNQPDLEKDTVYGTAQVTVAITAQGYTADPPANEVQLISFNGVSSGWYMLSFANGGSTATTSSLAWNANSTQVQSALQALATIGTGNVTVSGTTAAGFTVTFCGTLAYTNVAQLGYSGPLTGTPATYGVSEEIKGTTGTNEVHYLWFATAPVAGTYSLAFNGETTSALAWNVTKAQIQGALEALPTIGTGNIQMAGEPPGAMTITYIGARARHAQPLISINSLALTIQTPSAYSTEVEAGVPGIDEWQTLTAATMADGGTFSLTFLDYTTSDLAWNAQAADVVAALRALTSIGGANVDVAGGPINSGFSIAFRLALGSDNQPQIIANSSLSASYTPTIATEVHGSPAGISEVQEVFFANVTGGTFTLAFSGATTTAVAWNATAAQLKGALEAIGTVGTGNIMVEGSSPWVFTFVGTLAGIDQPLLVVNGASLTPTVTGGVTETTKGLAARNEVHEFNLTTNADSGTWLLWFNGSSVEVNYNSSAAQLETALEAVYGPGSAHVTLGPSPAEPLRVEWGGDYGLTDQAASTTASWVLRPSSANDVVVGDLVPGTTGINASYRLTAPDHLERGTWTITASGGPTGELPWNCSVAEALAAAASVFGSGNVSVTSPGTGFPRDTLVMTFGGALASKAIDAFVIASYLACKADAPTVTTIQEGDPGTTVSFETVVANAGPNCWDCDANWSDGHVPEPGDHVVFWGRDVDCVWGLPQDWPEFASVTVWASYTACLGLPDVEIGNGSPSYMQPRPTTLKAKAAIWRFGIGDGPGCPFARVDLGAADPDTKVYVEGTGSRRWDIGRALMLTGGADDASLYIRSGDVGIAVRPDELAEFGSVNLGNEGSVNDVQLLVGEGATIGAIVADGGFLELYCSYDTMTLHQGEVYQFAGAPGDTTIEDPGRYYYETPENGGVFVVLDDGLLDFSRGTEAVTLEDLDGTKIDPLERVTVGG
ncbi:MAG: hypothetical protein PHU85_00145 [Phycisphaerae bacterium]|nr:hypothetical protein [Phycisphaerae bacterium]